MLVNVQLTNTGTRINIGTELIREAKASAPNPETGHVGTLITMFDGTVYDAFCSLASFEAATAVKYIT